MYSFSNFTTIKNLFFQLNPTNNLLHILSIMYLSIPIKTISLTCNFALIYYFYILIIKQILSIHELAFQIILPIKKFATISNYFCNFFNLFL